MYLHLMHGDKLDLSTMIPMRKVSWMQRMVMRVTCVLYMPRVILKSFLIKQDKNLLNDGIKHLSGKKLVGTSSDISFQDVKTVAKALRVTINDLVTACLASTIKQYFELKGDKSTKSINITIPANIRFG